MIDTNKFVKILDWDDVPQEFKFRAQDADGGFYYYENKPNLNEEGFSAIKSDYFSGIKHIPNFNWQNSLEERPVKLVNNAEVAVKLQGKWYCGHIAKLINGDFQIWVHLTKDRINVTPTLEWKYLNEL